MRAAPVRRGVLVAGLLILALLALLDLLRHDSLLRSAWPGGQRDRPTPAEELLEGLKRSKGTPVRR